MIDYEVVSRALYRKLTDLVLEADGRKMSRPYALSATDSRGRTIFDATLKPHGRPKFSTDQGGATHLPLNLLLRSADGQWITDTLTESDFPPDLLESHIRNDAGHLQVIHRSNAPPYLTSRLGKKHCSVCGLVFEKSSSPSVAKAFAEHVNTAHDPSVPAEDSAHQDCEPRLEWMIAVEDLLRKTKQNLCDFLASHIALASTLADFAQKCADRKAALRSGDEAFKAYQTARDFLHRQNLTADEHTDLERRMEPLKAKLIELGKIVPSHQPQHAALTG